MSLSSGVLKKTQLNEQDNDKETDPNPKPNAENQHNKIESENTTSFFSYIASFYSSAESSDSADSHNEETHKKQTRKNHRSTETNTTFENRLPADALDDKISGTGNIHTRKRKSDPASWARNIRKAARIQGKPYISSKGIIQPGKMMKEPCTCRKKCFEKFSGKDREKIFIEFYKLSKEEQNLFLACSIEEYPKKTVRLRLKNGEVKVSRDRKRVSSEVSNTASTRDENVICAEVKNAEDITDKNGGLTSRRCFSRRYFLNNLSKERIEVCQTMFLNTLAVTLMKIRVIVQKKRSSGAEACFEDGRGKHGKQKQTAEETKQKLNKLHSKISFLL